MTFELLQGATPWIVSFIVFAALVVGMALAAVASSLVENRQVRVARHESVRSYYGQLVLGH